MLTNGLSPVQTKFLKWRLYDLDIVERWVHPSGKAVLLGDACHPMLPYMSQGAAQATEDAFILRKALRQSGVTGLGEALKTYQDTRRPRASRIQKAGRVLQTAYHLPDGSLQEKRDRLISQDTEENPIFWGSSERREWLFGYNADA
jgi:salicylate hydroxylase